MNWFKGIIDFITQPVTEIVGGWQARKTAAAKSKQKMAELDIELKVTKIKGQIALEAATTQAQIARVKRNDEADADYDSKVLDNRKFTIADELLIALFSVTYLLHFVPHIQPYMASGWKAMGYSGVPWWYEFAMVLILVSTLGGMRLLRMWTEKGAGVFKRLGSKESKVNPATKKKQVSDKHKK